MTRRAELHPSIAALRPAAGEILQALRSGEAGGYPSLMVERRVDRSFHASSKRHGSSEEVTAGVVLRIHDGSTLHEHATDALEPARLVEIARRFSREVAERPRHGNGAAYRPPTWAERLAEPLDPEIRGQIPEHPDPSTPVHFGTPFGEPPLDDDGLAMAFVQERRRRLEEHGAGLAEDDRAARPESCEVGITLERDDFLFVDGESNLSQTLLRNRLGLHVRKGESFGFATVGGLGGLETISHDAGAIGDAYAFLRSSSSGERLVPGRYRLVIGPLVAGLLAHEAFGHAQEGDTCARGRSKAWELYRSREPVGNVHATIVDNPAVFRHGPHEFGAYGSYYFDEEGWLARRTYLLREGVMQAPMTNLASALGLGVPRTANAKREDWSHAAYARQTNTYFSEGEDSVVQLFERAGDGYFAEYGLSGMEDPQGLGLQIEVPFVEEIRGGRRTGKMFRGPAGGAIQLTGYTPDVLASILGKSASSPAASGRALHPEIFPGHCMKYRKEIVIVGTGGTYILLGDVVLG